MKTDLSHFTVHQNMEVLSELEKGLTRNELDFDQNINDYKFLS